MTTLCHQQNIVAVDFSYILRSFKITRQQPICRWLNTTIWGVECDVTSSNVIKVMPKSSAMGEKREFGELSIGDRCQKRRSFDYLSLYQRHQLWAKRRPRQLRFTIQSSKTICL